MKTNKITFFRKVILCLLLGVSFGGFSQVGIGTTEPTSQAALDIRTTDKGLLMPRLTTAQRTTLGATLTTATNSNNKGMQVYDTDTNSIWFWNGTTWNEVADKSNLSTNNYVQANAYKANDLVIRNNKIYQANGVITANTAFVIGTTGATWKKISAIPEWVLTEVYETGDIVKKDGQFFEANTNISTNTAFVVGTTGATWKTLLGTAEYNFVYPTNGSTTSSATIADLPGATLTLPSAGVYRIYYNMSTTGNQDGGHCRFSITNASNSVYSGSSSSSTKIYGGSIASMATQELTITVNAPTTIKLRWNTNGSGTSELLNNTNYSSVFGYEKIAGFLPLTTGTNGINGIPNWTDGGAITIGATTTAPTKPTTRVADKVYYKQIGPKTWQVEMIYRHDNATGATNGTGDYLITLPNGLSFDQTILTQEYYTGNVGSNSYYHAIKGLPDSRVNMHSTAGYSATHPSSIIPWDATRFRVVLYLAGQGILPWGSGWVQIAAQPSLEVRINFTFQSAN